MNVLILGGDGFIGSYLLKKHLSNNDKCTIIDINNIRTNYNSKIYKYIHQDLSKSKKIIIETVKKNNIDLIYNCVAVATPDYYVKYPISTYEIDFKVNYENICKPIMNHKIPFIHFSTSEVYGKKWNSKYTEDDTDLIIGPTHKKRWIYATSKILLEQLILSTDNNNCIIIRPQNFCGWDMDWLPDTLKNNNKKWIPRLPACFLNSLIYNKKINVVKPGTQKRCYTHIDDGIDGIFSIINKWDKCLQGKIFNIGNPKNELDILSTAKLYQTIWKKLTNKNPPSINLIHGEKFYGEGYEDCERRLFCDKKIRKYTKWKAKLNINQTITKIIQDVIKNYET